MIRKNQKMPENSSPRIPTINLCKALIGINRSAMNSAILTETGRFVTRTNRFCLLLASHETPPKKTQ